MIKIIIIVFLGIIEIVLMILMLILSIIIGSDLYHNVYKSLNRTIENDFNTKSFKALPLSYLIWKDLNGESIGK